MQIQHLALSPKFLKRLSYHKFWGLSLDITGVINFYDLACELHENNVQRNAMEREVSSVLHLPGFIGSLIRWLYWIFNINNYCENYYKLQVYYAWRQYEERITMFSKTDQDKTEQQGGFVYILSREARRLYEIYQHTELNIDWRIVSLFSSKQTLISSLNQLDLFDVDEYIQVRLQVLGIPVVSACSIQTLKESFRKSCLKHHPDKGGNEADFVKIKKAYDEIVARIYPNNDPFNLKIWIAEIERQFKIETIELQSSLTELKDMNKVSVQKFAQSDARFAQSDARFAQSDARFAQSDARFTELKQKLQEADDSVRELEELFRSHGYQIPENNLSEQLESNQYQIIEADIDTIEQSQKTHSLTFFKHEKQSVVDIDNHQIDGQFSMHLRSPTATEFDIETDPMSFAYDPKIFKPALVSEINTTSNDTKLASNASI